MFFLDKVDDGERSERVLIDLHDTAAGRGRASVGRWTSVTDKMCLESPSKVAVTDYRVDDRQYDSHHAQGS